MEAYRPPALPVHPERVPLLPRVVIPAVASVALTGAALVHPPTSWHSIYAIGDSWAAGLYSDAQHALIQDAADELGATATVDGESGSGYLIAPPGTRTYPERAAAVPADTDADLVIVQGGSNDDIADLKALPAAVTRTVEGIRHSLPRATIVLLGPGPDPWPVSDVQRKVGDIIAAQGARLGVRVISPLQEDWFTAGDVDDIIDPVTAHPTVQGDAVLGADLAADLRSDGHRSGRGDVARTSLPAERSIRSRRRAPR